MNWLPTFAAPLLLLGLLAMAIPLLLHLLARSRAQEMLFPTLRFLRISMEKTARRRRVQHLLLMILRMAMLGALALAVAEPITRALGGWTGGKRYACAVILDNSLSMSAAPGPGNAFATRLDKAKTEAKALLSGDEKPALAALLVTNGPGASGEEDLSAELDVLRDRIDQVAPSCGRAPLADRIAAAVRILEKQSVPQKAIYVFSDLQKATFEEVAALEALAKAKDIHLLVVNTAEGRASNVAVTDVTVDGQRIVDQLLTVSATLENSSPTDRVVDVGLRMGGQAVGQKVRQNLRAAGQEGSAVTVRFQYRPREAGTVAGEVAIDQADDLPPDNVRRLVVQVGGRVKALVVRGPGSGPVADPAWMLLLALDPFADKSTPWSISPTTVEADAFTAASLNGADIVFLCDVPRFTEEQAAALAQFAAGGGTVALFLGPGAEVDNYNDVFLRAAGGDAVGGLLPVSVGEPVGELGPKAVAQFLNWLDLQDPYFKGLYEDLRSVKVDIRGFVQRYHKLGDGDRSTAKVLVRLENDAPLIVSKKYGRGAVVVCATSSAPGWSNLPATTLFPSMAIRMSLLARRGDAPEQGFLADSQVTISVPPARGEAPGLAAATAPAIPESNAVSVTVTLPPGEDGKSSNVTLRAVKTTGGYEAAFAATSAVGVYPWQATSAQGEPGATGAFAVNPPPTESRLETMAPDALAKALDTQDGRRVYIAGSFREVNEAALAAAQKRNWWDVLAALAIVVLVVEAVVANRARKPMESAIPAHLNPKIAG